MGHRGGDRAAAVACGALRGGAGGRWGRRQGGEAPRVCRAGDVPGGEHGGIEGQRCRNLGVGDRCQGGAGADQGAAGERRVSAGPRRPLILVGPSGVGKTTIADALVRRRPDLFALSVSATTRRPRAGERPGREYTFVSRTAFETMIEDGHLAEWAEVHGEYYGTPAENLEGQSGDGPVPVLDIDVQGAAQIMERGTGAFVIFILPPGPAKWIDRLAGRGTESPRAIARRLKTALEELRAAPSFEHFVVNADLDRTVERVQALAAGRSGRLPQASEVAVLCRGLEAGARSEIRRLDGAPKEKE
ncbi:MAG: guanylate kinase [Gemmatimonadetes bacterium]|nr:guanylate kinase [Gemmatimonadota bacterium]